MDAVSGPIHDGVIVEVQFRPGAGIVVPELADIEPQNRRRFDGEGVFGPAPGPGLNPEQGDRIAPGEVFQPEVRGGKLRGRQEIEVPADQGFVGVRLVRGEGFHEKHGAVFLQGGCDDRFHEFR